MSRFKLFIPLTVFVLLGGLLYLGLQNDPAHLPSALVDKPLPDFKLKVLGEEKVLSKNDLLGEPFLLNVWATWCPTCRVENPFFIRLSEQGVKIVGINYKDQDSAAMGWLKHFGNPYSVNVVDNEGRFGIDLGVYGAPETFLVDSNGVIRYKHVGVVDEDVWRRELAPLML